MINLSILLEYIHRVVFILTLKQINGLQMVWKYYHQVQLNIPIVKLII